MRKCVGRPVPKAASRFCPAWCALLIAGCAVRAVRRFCPAARLALAKSVRAGDSIYAATEEGIVATVGAV